MEAEYDANKRTNSFNQWLLRRVSLILTKFDCFIPSDVIKYTFGIM